MNADKFAELQLQMRNNQTDLQDYLRELDSWESDIKKKDETLKKQKPESESSKALPPVRNSLQKKKKKKKEKPNKSEADGKKPKRISGYDYRSWDKYDVDQVCEEIDDKAEHSSSSEYETDEEWEIQRQKQQALMEKDRGNQFFKEHKFVEAVECYTRGVECDPTNALLPANRAMALIKQEKYAAAEEDCCTAVTLDPTYVKAYSRRGTARVALKKFKEARQDFHRVLTLEPTNKQAKTEIERLNKILDPPPKVEPEVDSEYGTVKPIYKPPETRSKKPLHRITIEELGVEDDERKAAMEKAKEAQSSTKKKITEQDNKLFDQQFGQASGTVPPSGNENNSNIEDHSGEDTSSQSELKLNLENSESTSESTEAKTIAKVPDESIRKKVSPRLESSPATSPNTSPRVPPAPSSSYQFQADWKVLKKHPEQFYQYSKQIDPATLPKLFGQALESDIFMAIMNTLKDYFIPHGEDVFLVLQHMTQVKRFSMTVTFLSSKEKQVVKELFDGLKLAGKHNKTDIDALARKYEV